MPYNNFLLILFGILLYWPLFFHLQMSPKDASDGFLFDCIRKLANWSLAGNIFILKLITMVVLLSLSIALNNLANDNRMFNKPQFLTGMSWILLTSFFVKVMSFSPILIAQCLLVIILHKILKLQQGQQKVKGEIFNIGLLAGCSVLIYSPLLYFIIWIGLLLIILRPVYLAEWLVLLMGIATPFYIAGAVLFLNDYPINLLLSFLHLNNPFHVFAWKQIVNLAAILLLGFIGLYHVQFQMRKLLVHARKSWSALFIYLLMGFVVLFFGRQSGDDSYLLMLLPASFLIASFFNYVQSSKITSLFFVLMVLWSLYSAYFI